MRVLWIAAECSLQDKDGCTGLVSRHEQAYREFSGEKCALGVTYMSDGSYPEKSTRGGISYFPVDANLNVEINEEEWKKTRDELLKVIEEFQPDVIHCFGAEWPYGAIVESTSVPVAIHMMGYLNIYFDSLAMVYGTRTLSRVEKFLRIVFPGRRRSEENARKTINRLAERERQIMAKNRFFLGRTEWDRNIVKYYSPGATYFYVPEAVKPVVYAALGSWRYHYNGTLMLFSFSSGDDRKGNGIILQTAKVLKELMGIKFRWILAGSKAFMPRFEESTGIRCEDVNIEQIGMIGDEQIVEELKKADFCIHPSVIDNSPHAVCEAQLVGCPVIASNVGGLPQLVQDGETGWMYPYNEPHTLAFLLGNLYRDRELLMKVSAKETEIAGARHNPQHVIGELLKTYEKIVTH